MGALVNTLVSVVIPTKNRRDLLLETLASIRAQTYDDWEAIVVDDGSNDGTAECVRALTKVDARIRFLPRASTLPGANVCRNEGLALSTGSYVIFLDSDDLLGPKCMEDRVRTMAEHLDLDFAVFLGEYFLAQPGDLGLLHNMPTERDDIDRSLSLDYPWGTASPIWRRAALERIGPWDESLPRFQDWEFHLRALIKGLRYRVFTKVDVFLRRGHRGELSTAEKHERTQRTLRAVQAFYPRLRAMLREARCLTPERDAALAALYLYLAESWVGEGNCAEALAVWKACRDAGLVSGRRFSWGTLLLLLHRPPILRSVMYRWIGPWWKARNRLALGPSTFQKVSVPAEWRCRYDAEWLARLRQLSRP
jgi:glycosyltransferase involved in cell wall biosynthesis